MAYHSDSNVATKAGMRDRTDSNIARDGGKPKRIQTNIPIHTGMKDQTAILSGVSPANPGTGPDGGPSNPLKAVPKAKGIKDAPQAWGMRDANSKSING